MKLVQEKCAFNQFHAYGTDWVALMGEVYRNSLLVSFDTIQAWRPASFAQLEREDFRQLLDYRPELILLGTGQKIRFPAPALTRDLLEADIGVDVLDVGALCRTFNALVNEGRKPMGLILFS